MNALDVIDEVRAHQADVLIRNGRLVVEGRAEPLPEELQERLSKYRSEIMVALGAPLELALDSILTDMRPYLAPSLQMLPDGDLMRLINWNMIHAWRKAMAQAARS